MLLTIAGTHHQLLTYTQIHTHTHTRPTLLLLIQTNNKALHSIVGKAINNNALSEARRDHQKSSIFMMWENVSPLFPSSAACVRVPARTSLMHWCILLIYYQAMWNVLKKERERERKKEKKHKKTLKKTKNNTGDRKNRIRDYQALRRLRMLQKQQKPFASGPTNQ